MSPGPAAPHRENRLAALSPQKQSLLRALRANAAAVGGPRAADGRDRVAPRGTLVELRPGTDRSAGPVVLFHPIGGGVFCYAELARLLDGPRAVLGIAADESRGGLATVEETARDHLALLAAAGHRPAVLAGWSFGGLLAYQAARTLAATGGTPPPVVLIDSMSWPDEVPAWGAPETMARFVEDLLGSAGFGAVRPPVDPACWRLPPERALDAAAAQLREHGLDLGLDTADLVARHREYATATAAMHAYRPGPHGGPVTLLHADDSSVSPTEWRGRVTGPLTTVAMPGGHYDAVRSPNVRRAAELIRAAVG